MGCLKLEYDDGMTFSKSKKGRCRDYMFGFNTKEKVDEISGVGNHNTALFWEYDTRLGRRWNIDPVVKHSLSGYSTFANNPIWFVDINGDDSAKTANGKWLGQWTTEEGDNLQNLAKRFDNSTDALVRLNPNVNFRCLKEGTLINVASETIMSGFSDGANISSEGRRLARRGDPFVELSTFI